MEHVGRFGRFALIFLLCSSVGIITCDAVNLGNILKRRPMSSRKISQGDSDTDTAADEARKYHTACDRELARSLVIIGEQKEQSEAALDSCKSQRAEARDNVDHLTKRVEVVTESLDNAEVKCDAKLKEAETQMKYINAEHAEEITRLTSEHQSDMEELTTKHTREIEKQAVAKETALAQFTKEKEEILTAKEKEGADANLKLENILTENKKKLEKERADAKAKLKNTIAGHKTTRDELDAKWKSMLRKTETKLSRCDGSLTETSQAKETLENDYERALQKIAVLENVTAYSLAVEEAKDLAKFARQLVFSLLNPPYEKHLKEHIESVIAAIEQTKPAFQQATEIVLGIVERGKPVVELVTQPIANECHKLSDSLKESVLGVFDASLDSFRNRVCPQRTHLKAWEKERKLDPVITQAFDDVCGDPSGFLVTVGWSILILLTLVMRRYVIWALFVILLLPVMMLTLPFKLFLGSSRAKSKSLPFNGK